MKKAPAKLLSIATAGVFATSLFVAANGRSAVQARHAGASLPVLRMNDYVGAAGKLAKTLDPALVTSAEAADTIALVQQNLVTIAPNDKVILQLAQRYTVSKDRKTYTFYIRPKARYSNGDFVKASDIKASIDEALLPSTASPVATTYLTQISGAQAVADGKATTVSGIKVLGPRTISFHITKPFAFFLKVLTYPTADALDQKVIAGKTRAAAGNYMTSTCPGNVGSGPFKFKCSGSGYYPAGQTPSYTLVPNPYYDGKKPKIQISMPAIDTANNGYNAYKAGEIDMASIPTQFLAKERKNKKEFQQAATSIVIYTAVSTHVAPFNNVNCRLAAAYAVDRATIANKVLHGADKPIYDVVPVGFLGYYPGADNPHYNLAKAKAYAAKCPGKTDPVTYTYDTTGSDSDNRAAALVNMLQQAGFTNAKTKAITANDWFSIVASGYNGLTKSNTQMVFDDWQQDYPDPQDYIELLLDCNQDYNVMGWCNQKFHSLVTKADTEANTKKRAQEYIQAQHIAIMSGAWMTMYYAVNHYLFKTYVHGLHLSVAYADPVPNNMDWSTVSVSKH